VGGVEGNVSRRLDYRCAEDSRDEIINELEPVARSVYCGSIGCIDRSGSFDTNIAIRTLVFTPSDSLVGTEMAEIDHKIGKLRQATAGLDSSRSCSAR
jgi:anthranilate/para-aminobenzoate synthase component I